MGSLDLGMDSYDIYAALHSDEDLSAEHYIIVYVISDFYRTHGEAPPIGSPNRSMCRAIERIMRRRGLEIKWRAGINGPERCPSKTLM